MDVDDSHQQCLAGRFFTDSSPPSVEEAARSLRKQWNLSGLEIFSLFDEVAIVFRFKQEEDKRRVLEDGPWYVNGVLLILKDWSSDIDTDFSVSLFWVNVVGLPLIWYKDERAEVVKSEVSRCLIRAVIDPSKRVFRVLAEIDLTLPLNPGFYLGKHRFVQFSYRNLQSFCYKCGMVNHVEEDCDKPRKLRRLNKTTRKKIPLYGPWLRIGYELPDRVEVMFPENLCEKSKYEETLPYAQFFIELSVGEVYVYQEEKVGKIKNQYRFISDDLRGSKFRFPCSYLDTTSESGDCSSPAHQVLARELNENVSFAMYRFKRLNWPIKLRDMNSNSNVLQSLVDYMRFIKCRDECSSRKWLHLKLKINKVTMLTREDYTSALSEHLITRSRNKVEGKISDMIKRRVQNNEDLTSVVLWQQNIKSVLSGTKIFWPFDLAERALQAKKQAIELWLSWRKGVKPADEAAVLRLERMNVLGHDMETLDPCMICMEEMFLGEEAIWTPCSHVFHSACIESWLRISHNCPNCRLGLPSHE